MAARSSASTDDVEPWLPRRRGRPKGSFRGHGWSTSRAASAASNVAASCAPSAANVAASELLPEPISEEDIQAPAGVMSRLRMIARVLWTGCYRALFDAELAENEDVCGQAGQLPPTSYRARLKGERAELYDHRRRVQRRDELAIRLHANNERHWSPSMLARSVTYFSSSTAWQRQIEGRCV